ncbi:MAG: hypothetical protein ABJ084_02545 [Halioglobus sp.]
MSEAEIWQIIQSGNEISVMRIEVFITITVGVLIISSIQLIRLNVALLSILLGSYLVYGYLNFSMTVSEMHILIAGISQLHSMGQSGEELSLMGLWLAEQANGPLVTLMIPAMHGTYWVVTLSTILYAIWRYKRQQSQLASSEAGA